MLSIEDIIEQLDLESEVDWDDLTFIEDLQEATCVLQLDV